MLILIYGGSGSGKSEYAEDMAMELSKGENDRFYLATMKNKGSENQKRIKRHLSLREGKNFITIEQDKDIVKSLKVILDISKTGTVLLECVSNLVANEMFDDEIIHSKDCVAEKIISNILTINNDVDNFVVVSNDVHEDGICYDKATMDYISALGKINAAIAQKADRIIEVVAGIPVVVK